MPERHWSHFHHGADIGVRGVGASKEEALRALVDELAGRGIIIRSPSMRGVAEEAPGAYKNVIAVVDAADQAKISSKVGRLEPLICVKG